MKRLLSEPFLWFAVVALLLFSAEPFTQQPQAIRIDADIISRIEALWQTQMQRAPTADERQSLINQWLQDERFFREARRLGLDTNDVIVKRRLVQKYRFLMASAEDLEPSREALEAYYQANTDKYLLPERLSFSQILLPEGSSVPDLIKVLAEASATETDRRNGWREFGRTTLLPSSYLAKTRSNISSALGENLAERLFSASEDDWFGPVESLYGQHLIKIEERIPAMVTPLQTIVDKVTYDLAQEKAEERLQAEAERLAKSYPVVYE